MDHPEEKEINDSNGETSKLTPNVVMTEQDKIPYPKRVFLIFGSEFCERFNYYGLKAILVLYLKNKLAYDPNDATVLFHIFTAMTYSATIMGGIISDVWWGKFNTIFYLSMFYTVGSIIISIGAVPLIDLSPNITLIIGLVLTAIGAGGIKPCVSAFGADQFKIPEQADKLSKYFSLFYFTINAGPLISTTVLPILRGNVHCFGENDCYSLAFGVPAALMIISILFFVTGKSSYTQVKISSENMILQIFKCIKHAVHTKRLERKTKPQKNLLDYSIDKYGIELVSDIRIVMKILVLYLPLAFFWTLFGQLGSRWTLQANRMNGNLGFYIIKPDQMILLNSLLCILFVPLFEIIVYPILNKIGVRRPLQKITIGGTLTGISFLLATLVEFKIVSSPMHSVNMLWQVPQYVIMALGEVLFSVTGYAFSYEQAPVSMKSVLQSFWLLNIALGNGIFVVITKMNIVESQAHEFILFASLMFVAMFIFGIMAHNFKNNTMLLK
ncbi:peptide transporter family 1-like [Contarinia nasturtii]|uniref:peptide transporter family 1-like n=1 Tax=Contarinia nasturtii TaxID=265458 RepID=UPI0012D3EFBF|nr:peptide transporter family 1-like [Contarinia nasturtii]